MNGLTRFVLLGVASFSLTARPDTSVVFNEIMYHPATNEPAMEWLELYNQMAVDVDMSGWSLDGDIHYDFGTNFVIHGGAFAVVAISPTNLAAITGLTNILGPFTNRLSNSGGKLQLRNNYGRVVNELDYDTKGDWPVAPDGSGVSLAKIDHSLGSMPAANWTWSAQVGGTPGRENFPTNVAALPLSFNEISATTNADFWLELMNYGSTSLGIGGFVIVRAGATNGEYVLSPGIILPPGGFLTLSNSVLGFTPTSKDELYLLPAGRSNVLDAVNLKTGARARSPDGTGKWFIPSTVTPGSSNSFAFHSELVINEIMYHHHNLPPIATNMLPQTSPEQWVELYNRSSNTINLTGWSLAGGISFNFPSGKTIAAGAYLVVANDSATLRSNYPSIDIVGDFSGKLSHNGDSVELDDASDNPVSTVSYSTAGRWPDAASGGGSSLELRDPQADTMNPASWAASDETAKSVWITNIYQGVAQTIVGTDQWNDFLMGLLDSGECLVDDVSVIESPGGTPVQFIANGNFESGASGWRFLGTHLTSRVEPEPGNPANHVLHIIADGVQGDQQDHIETTYTSGRKVTNGRTYQISYRARWLSGISMLNSRLYYDRVPKTMWLPVPTLNGTPGARNSTYATNIGPTFTQFQHKPVIPAASQPVTVSVVAQDPQNISTCEVWWSANGAAFSHVSMTSQGGLYSGTIPGFGAGTLVQFYVRGVDSLGAVSTWPAAGSNSGGLYIVNDGQTDFSEGHNLRVLLSPANWALLRANTNLLGDGWLPGTVIYDDQKPYYDLSIRLKGSAYGRVGDPHPSFHIKFQPDDLFRGVHSSMLIDTSGRPGAPNQQFEICVHHMMLHAGGIPEIQADLCRCIPPFQTNSMTGVLEPRFEDEFITTAFPDGDNGSEFNMELDYFPTTANAQGYKLPSPESIVGSDITDLGNDKEIYRYNFLVKNNRANDDYTRFLPFAKMMNMPNTPLLDAQSQQLMDVNEWLRVFAMVSLVGESDWYTFGNPHNILIYNRPDDNKMMVFPWDVEQVFLRSGYPNCSIIASNWDWSDLEDKFPANTRRLYGHVQDIIASTFNTNYMAYWTAHYGSICKQDFSQLLTLIPQRIAAVNAEIAGAGGNTPFSTGTNFFVTANNLVTITGTAPVQVQSFLINGIAYPVTWSSISSWSINIPLSLATNVLNLTAYDLNGNAISNDFRTFTVNYTGPAPVPQGVVGFNEIMYNPAISNASYVELFNNSTNLSFDISNWRINGLGYTFPPGSIITNQQFLTLLKDSSAFINVYGTNLAGFDQFTGELSPSGETLTLFMPAAQTNLPEVSVDKVKYSTALPWPSTTPGISLQIRDPLRDHFRVGNWAAAAGTPKATNAVNTALPAFAPLWLNELEADNLTGITNHLGQRTAWLELYNPTTNAVSLTNLYLSTSYTNLTAWAMPTGAVITPGQFKVIFADGQTNNATSNELHTSFVLPSGAGSLAISRLFNSQTQTLDFIDYTNLMANRSYGDYPDAQSFDRMQFYVVTPGAANTNTSAPLSVSINEWMAGNTHTLTNPVNGKASDWFELYNYGTNTADLTGYYLTDTLTNQFQFQIPAGYTIPPHGFIVVWADGKSTNGTPELHVTFKMNKGGESLGLYGVDGTPIDFVNYGPQTDDVSEGRFPDGGPDRFFMPTPTPRTNNIIPNTPPVLDPISPKLVHFGQTVHFTATAADAEGAFQTLTFSLDPGFPAGATINPSTGDFSWMATNSPPPSTNAITIRVTDNGVPPMSGTQTFTVSVLPVPQLAFGLPSGGLLPLAFSTLAGQNYEVQYKDDLAEPSWTALGGALSGTGGVIEVDADMTGQSQRFFRLAVLPN